MELAGVRVLGMADGGGLAGVLGVPGAFAGVFGVAVEGAFTGALGVAAGAALDAVFDTAGA